MNTASSTLSLDRPAPSMQWRTRLTVGFVVVMVAFWQTWASFPQAWIERGEHGFVAAAFCGWLVWRDREQLLGDGRGLGLANVLVAGLSMLWLVAIILNIRVVHQAVLPLLLLAWLLATAGLSAFRKALPIAGAFFLAVPLWGLLIRPLQSMTVLANRALLSLTGIEVQFDGDLIAIPDGVFQVAEGCAGINFFEVGVLVGVMHALLFLKTWKARGLAVLVAALLAIVSNWLRVFGLILIGHFTQMQSPLIESHGTYGWIIFAVVLFTFFFAARHIEAWDERLFVEQTAAKQARVSAGTRPPRRRAKVSQSWASVLVPSSVALIGPVFLLASMAMPAADAPPLSTPGISPGAEWQLQPAGSTPPVVAVTADSTGRDPSLAQASLAQDALAQDSLAQDSLAQDSLAQDSLPRDIAKLWAPAYRGAGEHRVQQWADTGPTPTWVQVDRMLYADQSQGKELINSENRIARPADKAGDGLAGPLDDRGRRVNVTAVGTPESGWLVWLWVYFAGINSYYDNEAKLLELVAFATRASASELVAVSTLCGPEDCAAASRVLYRFVVGRDQPVQPTSAP